MNPREASGSQSPNKWNKFSGQNESISSIQTEKEEKKRRRRKKERKKERKKKTWPSADSACHMHKRWDDKTGQSETYSFACAEHCTQVLIFIQFSSAWSVRNCLRTVWNVNSRQINYGLSHLLQGPSNIGQHAKKKKPKNNSTCFWN